MGRYRFNKRKGYLQQGVWLFIGIVLGSIVLLVPPEAWFPGEDFIPNFWKMTPLLWVFLENQAGWFYLGIAVAVIMVGKVLYDMVK